LIGEVISVHFEWLLDTSHGADYFRRWHRDKRNGGGLMVHKATSPTSCFYANLGTLSTFGAEAQLGWYPAQNLEIQLLYTWLHKDKKAEDFGAYASRYALDYPEHLAQVSLLWRPVNAVEIGTVQTLRLQTDNAARTSSDFGADSSFVVRFTPPKADYATLSLLINDAWNDDFQAFPGQRPPERYVGASLTLTW